jgi:hypothetical protein
MKYLALFALFIQFVAAQSKTPVIVELFTSEGCSSCPPADNVVARLDRDQPIEGVEVVAMGEHVDYWDQLGWKDRFSSPLFTARQQDFGQQFRLESVYTPQIVVNGGTQVLGSDFAATAQAIREAAKLSRAWVSANLTGADTLAFEVRQLPQATRNADMFLAITESGLETAVGRGENSGRKLRHAPLVRSLVSLGQLDTRKNGAYSASARLMLNPQWNRQNLKMILFVQDHTTRHIVGTATLKL